MSIKLVALDMDGTLLNSKKELPPDFINWVKAHPDIKTVIASGRQYDTIVRDFISVKDKLIFAAENGGLVLEQDKIIYKNEIQKEDICRCLKIIDQVKEMTPVVCGAKSAYTRVVKNIRREIEQEIRMYYVRLRPVENLYSAVLEDVIVKIAVFVDGKNAESAMKYFTDIGEHMETVLSGDSWIDISYRTVSKGAAITAIQHKYGIKKEESMAFGDYLNDKSLFEVCEESYCMGNGHPDLEKMAKYITDTNDNDGVMKVLRRL